MFVSTDGHWRIYIISRDGTAYYRIAHDGTAGIHLHHDGKHRAGPIEIRKGWYLAEDVRTVSEVEQYISLEDLEEVQK